MSVELETKIEDLAQKAQRAAEVRLHEAMDRYWASEEGDDTAWDDWDGAPYDGCDTCLVREVLQGAWPILLEAAQLEAQLFGMSADR